IARSLLEQLNIRCLFPLTALTACGMIIFICPEASGLQEFVDRFLKSPLARLCWCTESEK
ncbi:hypothetical protein QUH42_02915, partial [Klebsiella grimontii]|uniref:hypothetical protein n=1 Tax=Klebsiella grimontii TaxID=2058152 RepID=UPI0025A1D5F9